MPCDHEVEVTFAVPAADVPRLAVLLVSAPSGWAAAGVEARRRAPRTTLHFYLRPGDSRDIRRIRVKASGGALGISLESKRVLKQGVFLAEKEERVDQAGLSLDDAQALLAAPGSVISSFIKNQYRVFFKSRTSAFKASLDQVIPFRPGAPAATAAPIWHLELEEKLDWDPEEFLGSLFFRQELSSIALPLLASKWDLARMGPPGQIPAESPADAGNYLDSLLLSAGNARPSWHDLQPPAPRSATGIRKECLAP
jgi:hypothetical protein